MKSTVVWITEFIMQSIFVPCSKIFDWSVLRGKGGLCEMSRQRWCWCKCCFARPLKVAPANKMIVSSPDESTVLTPSELDLLCPRCRYFSSYVVTRRDGCVCALAWLTTRLAYLFSHTRLNYVLSHSWSGDRITQLKRTCSTRTIAASFFSFRVSQTSVRNRIPNFLTCVIPSA